MEATTGAAQADTTMDQGAAPAVPKTANKPSAIAFNVRQGGDGKRNFWIRTGIEYAHADGKGSTVILNVMPLDGRITVRAEADADKAAEENAGIPPEPKANPKAPDQIAYSVREVKGRGDFWTEVGTVYRHRDGKGKQIVLHQFPLDNRLVLRDRTERVRAEPKTAEETAEA